MFETMSKGPAWALRGAVTCLFLFASSAGFARGLSVTLVADNDLAFPMYAAAANGEPGTTRAYVAADPQARYRIRVRNHRGTRVGVVIAVDGRNIISGQRSELSSSEAKYIIGPYETQWFDGWRSDARSVNRFYFTEPGESYAGAFGDYSAMGVVAVAAYGEHPQARQTLPQSVSPGRRDSRSGHGAGAESASNDRAETAGAPVPQASAPAQSQLRRKHAEAGTGHGERRHSPVSYTHFNAHGRAFARHFLKYEWQETLVALGVIPRPPRNRFWPSPATVIHFAPPPPIQDGR